MPCKLKVLIAMSKTHFDLEFRPTSYWGPQNLENHFRSRWTGELRGRAISEEADSYQGSDDFLQSSIDPSIRPAIGAMHPSLMGGEYLPPLLKNEVEIARVALASTLGDVTSVRARKTKHRIVYRVVDEYMEQGADRFNLPQKTSRSPLSLGQIISIIDQNDLIAGPRNLNLEGGSGYEDVFNFATVSSVFYLQLTQYFEEEGESWRLAQEAEYLEDEEEYETFAEEAQVATDERERAFEPWREQFDAFMAEWLKAEGPSMRSIAGRMGHGMRRGALKNYVMSYCLSRGVFPSGRNQIEWNDGKDVMNIDFPT